MKNNRPVFFWLFFVSLLFAAALSLPSAHTAASGFPPRPTLIPTETAVPTATSLPVPTATPSSSTNTPQTDSGGALIYLHVPTPPSDLQTVVQWQDGLGNWHDIEGWRGTLNQANFIVWWVAPHDLGAVWYRWQVYTADGRITTHSDAFSLPTQPNQNLHILVTLTP